MALLATMQRQAIQEAVDQWRDRCLVGDGLLLFVGKQVWTHDNLARLYRNVIGVPLTDRRTFMEKFHEQLGGDRDLVLLGAEVLAVYYLIADAAAVRPATKRQWVGEALS
jgi:5-methylcytosine-specific restriction enzyme B